MNGDAADNTPVTSTAQDAALFARMRRLWADVDPVPADLIDRMVAAIAMEGLSREYALLMLVEPDFAAVRSESDVLTLQFSDGTVTVLLHVTRTEHGTHRIDGWVDAVPLSLSLVQDAGERTAASDANGRFAFDDVPGGMSRVHLTVSGLDDDAREFRTPQFEL